MSSIQSFWLLRIRMFVCSPRSPWSPQQQVTKAVVKNMMQDSLEFFTLDSVDDYCHGLEIMMGSIIEVKYLK